MSTRVAFNYDILPDAKSRSEAKKHAALIAKLLKTSAESVIEIGRSLGAVRETMQPAMFRAWIEHEFHWVPSTAFSYMQAARIFGDLDCLGKFQPTSIIMLARSNVPEKVVEKMVARARLGEVITQTEVKAALRADKDFQPSRKDAGVARNPSSPRSLAADQAPALTIDALQKSLDTFSASLSLIEMEQRDREALANRFFELAVQLRMVQSKPATPPSVATKSKPGKTRTTKAA